MATDLTRPYTGSFNTTNMLIAVAEGITADFLQKTVQNTGHNDPGFNIRGAFGKKNVDLSSSGTATSVDIGNDATAGVSDFTGAATYSVILTWAEDPGTLTGGGVILLVADNTSGGTFDITPRYQTKPFAANDLDVYWLAIGT